MKEIFKKIKGLEGFYEVSNTGKVKSLPRLTIRSNGRELRTKERIMTNTVNFFGYETVYLNKKRLPVHRLVAIAFIENHNNYPEVNHKDGNKRNNKVENLEWCNRSMNMFHAYNTNLREGLKGDKNPMYGKRGKDAPCYGRTGLLHPQFGKSNIRAKSIFQLDRNGNIVNEYVSANQAAVINNFFTSNIVNCANKKNGMKSYKGYIWKYK